MIRSAHTDTKADEDQQLLRNNYEMITWPNLISDKNELHYSSTNWWNVRKSVLAS